MFGFAGWVLSGMAGLSSLQYSNIFRASVRFSHSSDRVRDSLRHHLRRGTCWSFRARI